MTKSVETPSRTGCSAGSGRNVKSLGAASHPDVASPTVLMLRIFPDVRVRIHVEANAAGSEP